MKFECTKCHYVADRKELPKRCPYCGQESAMSRAKNAQELLSDLIDD